MEITSTPRPPASLQLRKLKKKISTLLITCDVFFFWFLFIDVFDLGLLWFCSSKV
jgi:hypothetical protein